VAVRREPLGVVALITPWNYPLLMATVSLAVGEREESAAVRSDVRQLHACKRQMMAHSCESRLTSTTQPVTTCTHRPDMPAAAWTAVEGGACAGCWQLLCAQAQ
jgi:hypothetical protein